MKYRKILLWILSLMIFLSTFSLSAFALERPQPIIGIIPISAESDLSMFVKATILDPHDRHMTLALEFFITNKGNSTKVLQFNTSQTFDYWLKGENFSYHYADGKAFLQVITKKKILPGQTISLGTDIIRVPYGVYELNAVLVGHNVGIAGIINATNEAFIKRVPIFIPFTELYSYLQITASVKKFIVSDNDNVAIDFYLQNKGKHTIRMSEFPITLDILAGHGAYIGYTSQYDDGKYLHFKTTGTITLKPGEKILLASFKWDQNANVRTFTKKVSNLPTYIVVIKNKEFLTSMDSIKINIPAGTYHMGLPIFKETDMIISNPPDWLTEYLSNLHELLIPGNSWNDEATRAQVLWGVFKILHYQPISVIGKTFKDVKIYDHFESILETLKKNDILKGYPDGTVRLQQPITRAEAVTILIRTLEKAGVHVDETEEMCNSFKDIKGNEWYAKYVCQAKLMGIVNGYPDGTFKANRNVTVAEIVKMLSVVNAIIEK